MYAAAFHFSGGDAFFSGILAILLREFSLLENLSPDENI
jgi:hypothetical protein